MKNPATFGIDALGRKVTDEGHGKPRKDRLVGMFYFLWLGETGRHAPYDISKITKNRPDAGYHPELWGGIGTYHHWGEPFYGYYYSDDEWVVRKHIKLLMQADIDFIFFDTTNAEIYEDNAKLVMSVIQEYIDLGFKAPKVMFYTNTHSGPTVQRIYDGIYKKNFCPGTWFIYDKKPLIIAIEEECSPECREFFDIKKSQWPNEADKLGGWPWMDFTRPQRVFKNMQGEDEVINVSVAQHPQIMFGDSVLYGEKANRGRAYHNGENDPGPDAYVKGFNFAEQFERAIEADPPVVLVTGWNEWIAGRWQGPPERPLRFVDCCNYEYSRDIEMMRGGYFDNYYMQLAHYVRKYKGCERSGEYSVGECAVFENVHDGNMKRDAEGYGTRYTSNSERNAVISLKAENLEDSILFTVEAKEPLSDDKGGDLMSVFIGCGDKRFVVTGGTLYSLSGFERAPLCDIPCSVKGKSVSYEVKKSELGITGAAELYLKAADSRSLYSSEEDFYDKGDAFPLGRLNIVYRIK